MTIELAWHQWVGIAGAAFVLLAYFGLQTGRLRGDGIAFQVANIIGAGAIALSLVFKFNAGAMFIELAWIAISVYGLVRGIRSRAAQKAAARAAAP